ncbi:P-loop containing nucleoside triphosphate hydrolase protein [Fomes fomentarius]|nr:P-loop containing nucleoside triphosphate hydrolase protein [Fomes fomentarius]
MSSPSPLSTRGLVPDLAKSISVVHLDHRDCGVLQDVLDHAGGSLVLGVSLRLSKKGGAVEAVALATPTVAYLVFLGRKDTPTPSSSSYSGVDLARILSHPHCLLAGLNVTRTALLLYRQLGSHVVGVELTSLPTNGGRPSAAQLADTYLGPKVHKRDINSLWLLEGNLDLALKAWLLGSVAAQTLDQILNFAKADTRALHQHQLYCLAQLVVNVELVQADQPTRVENDFDKIEFDADGKLILRSARYKSRVRSSAQTVVEINGGKIRAHAVSSKGKSTGLRVFQGKFQGKVKNVSIVGREEATLTECARDEFLLRVLQGAVRLDASPYVRMLWYPEGKKAGKKSKGAKVPVGVPLIMTLNPSQKRVVAAMLADDEPLVVVHGPPGTGKTSTISAALSYWQNIAKSLFTKGIDFKLIVSEEFHFEWHEHLYDGIERNLIRSDDFGAAWDVKNWIGDTTIMLCTLSMLSNPALIDTFEFKHLYYKFRKSESPSTSRGLSKVCMFGDPNQLPPFGSEAAPKMKTIFDFKHLKDNAYFLDMQYRMPVPLGNFISEHVYDLKLKSVHTVKDSRCVQFIDVRKGKEEKVGRSWKNVEEIHTIVNIVKKYYNNKKYCIITPYDPQRGAITAALKAAGVEGWEEVYNVDSFQSHEAPYVIVSVVRTNSPGFLKSLHRLNVMLTRCQQGMVIVSQRAFLHNGGKKTLVGKLAEHWEKKVGEKAAWADAMQVAEGRASLPGAPGKSSGALVAKRAALSVSA